MPRYRADTPPDISQAGADAFGHKDYARALVDTLQAVEAPFTIGLFGEWGTGKTTILKEVERQLAASGDTEVVIFDAWRYEGEALRREFLTDLCEQLWEKGQLTPEFNAGELREDLTTERTENRPLARIPWATFAVSLAQVVAAAALVLLTVWLVQKKLDLSKATILASYPVIISAALVFALNTVRRTIRIEHVQVRTPRLQDPDLFARRFREVLAALKSKRLVVAIDNLDRCSPDRVSEMLATIKTFLEPESTDRELLFVIAADHEALRRHLIAQEARSSAAAVDDSDVGHAKREVDEYLRKFFNASVRVNDALDEEAQAYTRRELAEFFESESIDGEAADDIVDMVVSALRRNPRRIKQFVNNLQLKLDVLRAREASGLIRPRVSTDGRLVAKLLIIEEQWPERYEQLRTDHRLLREWHERAAAPQQRDGEQDTSDEAWTMFLLATQHIDDRHARAVIHLKLVTAELSLPMYADFTAALDAGQSDQVDWILGDSTAAEGEQYAAVAERHFRVQSRRSRAEALNTVRVLLQAERFRERYPHVVGRILAGAIGHPVLIARLRQLDACLLFRAAESVDDGVFQRLVRETLVPLARDDASSDQTAAFAAALVPYSSRVDEDTKAAVREALVHGSGDRLLDPRVFPLVQADPGFIPPALVAAAIQQLAESQPLTPDKPEYELAALGVRLGVARRDAAGELLRLSIESFRETAATDPKAAKALLENITTWLGAGQLDADVATTMAHKLIPDLGRASPDLQRWLFRIVSVAIGAAPESEQASLAAKAVDTYFGVAERDAVDFFVAHSPEIPRAIREEAGRRLVPVASGGTGADDRTVHAAVRAIVKLPRPGTHLVQAATTAASHQRPANVAAVLKGAGHRLSRAQFKTIGDLVASELPNYIGESAVDGLSPLLLADARDIVAKHGARISELLLAQLSGRPQEVQWFLGRCLTTPGWQICAQDVLRRVAARVNGESPGKRPRYGAEIELLGQFAAELPAGVRHQTALGLVEAIAETPSFARVCSTALHALVEKASCSELDEYVQVLRAAEGHHADNVAAEEAIDGLVRSLSVSSAAKAARSARARIVESLDEPSQEPQPTS